MCNMQLMFRSCYLQLVKLCYIPKYIFSWFISWNKIGIYNSGVAVSIYDSWNYDYIPKYFIHCVTLLIFFNNRAKKKKARIKVLKTTLSASLCIFDLSGL
jgi:hypothetical protein